MYQKLLVERLVVIARGTVSPRASARDEVVAVFGPRVDVGGSLPLGVVVAGADHLPGLPWAVPWWLTREPSGMTSLCLAHRGFWSVGLMHSDA